MMHGGGSIGWESFVQQGEETWLSMIRMEGVRKQRILLKAAKDLILGRMLTIYRTVTLNMQPRNGLDHIFMVKKGLVKALTRIQLVICQKTEENPRFFLPSLTEL